MTEDEYTELKEKIAYLHYIQGKTKDGMLDCIKGYSRVFLRKAIHIVMTAPGLYDPMASGKNYYDGRNQ